MMPNSNDRFDPSGMIRTVRDSLAKITRFLKLQEDIHYAIVIGSQARKVRPADEWSDIDIVIVTSDPERYLQDSSWLEGIGIPPRITFVEKAASGGTVERRALFSNGVAVDFSIFPFNCLGEVEESDQVQEEFVKVLRRGVIIIKDEGEMISSFVKQLQSSGRMDQVPGSHEVSEQEFSQSASDFFFHFVWTNRKLNRGELWSAKTCLDCYMKSLLIQMVEWHAKAENSEEYDVWHSGRFIEQWADRSIIAEFHKIFAHYDYHDIESALHSTVRLYARIAKEVAHHYEFNYPKDIESFAWEQVGKTPGKGSDHREGGKNP